MKNNNGFSLVELAIAIAVITILILAIAASAGMRDNARIQSASNSVQTLRSAAENYLSGGQLDYTGMDIEALKTAQLLPTAFSGTSSNSFGGNFSIGPDASDATHFQIALSALNQSQANKLTSIFQNNATSSSYDATNKIWAVIF
jgi:prepilin-type N-terminal cleavage/methylation domain-containing protein